MPPRPRRSLPRQFDDRSNRSELRSSFDSSPSGNDLGLSSSSSSPAQAPFQCLNLPARQIIGGDHEDTIFVGIRHVNHLEISPGARLSVRNHAVAPAADFLQWSEQYVAHFILVHVMIVD